MLIPYFRYFGPDGIEPFRTQTSALICQCTATGSKVELVYLRALDAAALVRSRQTAPIFA